MVARLPKSEKEIAIPTSSVPEKVGFFLGQKQMGLLSPPEQPIAGHHAAGRDDPLLFLCRVWAISQAAHDAVRPIYL